MRTLMTMSFAAAVSLLSVACNNGVADKIENRYHCRKICDKFGECFGGDDYDTDQCNTECRDKSSEQDFDDKATVCKKCLDDISSCVNATTECTDECAEVVLESN
jgi:hypothetical protein